MKRIYTYAALALMTLGFAGCRQEDGFTPQGGGEQELRIATRSTTEGESTADSESTFTRDFYLYLWNSNIPKGYERHAMSYDGTSWNVVKTSYLDDSTVAAAIAGTAASIDFIDGGYDIIVPTDQTGDNIDDYDMMFAYSKEVNSSTPLSLHFEHLFVKLTFNIEYGSEYTTPPTFAFVGINPNGYLHDKVIFSGIQNGNSTPTYSRTSSTMFTNIKKGDEDNHKDDKIEVIVGYGTLPAGTEFLDFYKVGDYENPLIVKVPEGGLTFEKGKHYTFNLKVGKDKVTLTPTAASNFPGGWDKDTETDLN